MSKAMKKSEKKREWVGPLLFVGVVGTIGVIAYYVLQPIVHTPRGTPVGYRDHIYYISQNPDGSWHGEYQNSFKWASFDKPTKDELVTTIQNDMDVFFYGKGRG